MSTSTRGQVDALGAMHAGARSAATATPPTTTAATTAPATAPAAVTIHNQHR